MPQLLLKKIPSTFGDGKKKFLKEEKIVSKKMRYWEQIKTYNAGWFIDVENDDIKEIFRNIFQISNEELLVKSKNAYKLSLEYTWDKIYPKFEKVYLGL